VLARPPAELRCDFVWVWPSRLTAGLFFNFSGWHSTGLAAGTGELFFLANPPPLPLSAWGPASMHFFGKSCVSVDDRCESLFFCSSTPPPPFRTWWRLRVVRANAMGVPPAPCFPMDHAPPPPVTSQFLSFFAGLFFFCPLGNPLTLVAPGAPCF